MATIRLGITTDTCDLEGRVVATAPVPSLSLEGVDRACRRFVGRIRQTPPMYSAVHHEGRRLYELARQGLEVAREAREVVVHAMDVLELDGDRLTVRVVCGKGTYVRALAADLGADLGCGAAVEHLDRVRVGPFTRADALSPDDLLHGERTALLARLLPVDAAARRVAVGRVGATGRLAPSSTASPSRCRADGRWGRSSACATRPEVSSAWAGPGRGARA